MPWGQRAAAEPENPYAKKAADLKGAVATLGGMMPDADAPGYQKDPEQFAVDFQTWLSMYLDTSDAYSAMQRGKYGYVTLPDGSLMPTGDLSPEERMIFDQANEAKYQNTLSALGLQASNIAAERAQAGFNNQMDRVTQAGRIDDTRLRKSEAEVSRALGGRSESRNRAQLISEEKRAAAPYATSGGKTAFSGNDLGSLLGEFSSFAGVDPNSSLLKYTGTSMIDPEADMARFDTQMGVGGELPGLAELMAGGGDFSIPGVPDLGALPQLSASRVNLGSLLSQAQPAAAPASGGAAAAGAAASMAESLLRKLLGNRTQAGASGATPGSSSYLAGAGRAAPPAWEEPGAIGALSKSLQGRSLLSGRQ
jgi:hypothetical protein